MGLRIYTLFWNGENQMEKVFKKVELKVNGKEVPLNPFSNNVFGNAIWGMVNSLKLEEKPETVEIRISLQ